MEIDARRTAYTELADIAAKQGYITFDDIMDISDEHSLSLQDFDWLSSSLTSSGVLIYDSAPHQINAVGSLDDEYDDFAQVDYSSVYNRITELSPSLKPFVETVKNILPPQFKEVSQLKYQVLEGNDYARKRMIEMHLRIAFRIALQRSEAYDLDIEDTISSAIVGLITAIDKYDPDVSGAFSSYAALWIVQCISRDQVNSRPLIYYPVHKKEGFFSVYPFLKKYGCTECDKAINCNNLIMMIMEKNNCDRDQANDIVHQMTPGEYINYDQFSDDEFDKLCLFYGLYENDDEVLSEYANRTFIRDNFRKCLHLLSPKEEFVIVKRYGLFDGHERTLEEIGNEMGVTRERVRQVESKGLRKLKKTMGKIVEIDSDN